MKRGEEPRGNIWEVYISTSVFGFVEEMPTLSKDFFFSQESRPGNSKQGHTRK